MVVVESICQKISSKDESNPVDEIEDVFQTKLSDSNLDDFEIKNENQKQLEIGRGKFLKPCPDIELLEQIPITKRRLRKVIKNCNLLKPKKVNNIKITIITSSYFDRIFEIMISSYFMIQKFQNYVNNDSNVFDKNKQKFFHILHDYVKNFNISRLNNERITVLNDVCNCSKIEKFAW